jgi:hypothetical protein
MSVYSRSIDHSFYVNIIEFYEPYFGIHFVNNFSDTQMSSIFYIPLHPVFFRYLIETWDGECFINVCNNLGKTALHEAAQNCFHQTVKYLLQHGMSYLFWDQV